MKEPIEMEKKYLIKSTEQKSDRDLFKTIVEETRALESIKDFRLVSGYDSKKRPYRFFDTFDMRLTEGKSVAYIGPMEQSGGSLSIREREHDSVLTVKFKLDRSEEEREEHEFPIPKGTNFYELNPEDFEFWAPLKKAKVMGMNRPLQEIIRLEVSTNRFNWGHEGEQKVQVALDEVIARIPFKTTQFYELEIEKLEYGEDVDVDVIDTFFTQRYGQGLLPSSFPKWIKAMRLMRGESLVPE